MCCLRVHSHLTHLAEASADLRFGLACRLDCASRHSARCKNAVALCAGVPGDGHTYAALTRGYAQAGDLQRALGTLDHMVEAGSPTV